jgi:hypothetical protein
MSKNRLPVWVCLAVFLSCTAMAGIEGHYYESAVKGEFTTLAGTQWDLSIDADWGTSGPGVLGLRPDLFAIRWEGLLRVATPGTYTFYSVTDDGARLYINDQAIIDKWVDQGAVEHSGSVTLPAGDHELVFEYYENTGGAVCRLLWAGPGIPKQVIPPSAFVQPTEGFSAEFFNSADPLTGTPAAVANVPHIAFTWGENAPAAGVNKDHFTARFQGWFIAPEDGIYSFTVASDDGSDLYVGGVPVIENFAYPQPITEKHGDIELLAGERYLLDLRYAELAGGAGCYLYWQAPSMASRALMDGATVMPAMRIIPVRSRAGVLHRTVGVGANVVMAFYVEQALAPPTYTWYFSPADAPETTQALSTGTATDGTITLELSDVGFNMSGTYWCVADDGRGPMASAPFTIEVVEALPVANGLGLGVAMALLTLLALQCIRREKRARDGGQ